MRALAAAVRQTVSLFGSQRKLWIPFLVVACFELGLLGLVWLAPQPPFSTFLAPPVRYFFSERVLHYPVHLWFLYHVMPSLHLAATTLLGAFMSGVACAMVRQAHEGSLLSLRNALVSGQVRYGAVLAIWGIMWALSKLVGTGVMHVAPKAWPVVWTVIGATVVLQALLVYAIPVTVFAGAKWWKALWQSVRETMRHPISTLIIVAIPSAAIIAFTIMITPACVGRWMQRLEPEIVFAFIAGRLFLWTIADALMTVGIAHLWFSHRAQPSVQPSHSPFPIPLTSSVATLLMLCAVLSSTSCSASYNGERLFVKANALNAPILKNPKEATPAQIATAIQAFERVAQKARGTVWAAQSYATIGLLYEAQQQDDSAREAYGLIIQNYPQYSALCLAARLATAKIYEKQQNQDAVVATYEAIADYHQWTTPGLQAPLAIAKLYEKQQLQEQAAKAYERAISRYTKLVPQAPTPEFAYQVKSYLELAYQGVGQWQQAITALEEMANGQTGDRRALSLYKMGTIYQIKLNDPEKAKAAYAQVAKEFPEGAFGKAAKQQLERLPAPPNSPAS